jgi:mediator of RNA polymerase II transcription subunit 4
VQVPVEVEERLVHREEPGRRYDPDAVFQLELNSDESDDE